MLEFEFEFEFEFELEFEFEFELEKLNKGLLGAPGGFAPSGNSPSAPKGVCSWRLGVLNSSGWFL